MNEVTVTVETGELDNNLITNTAFIGHSAKDNAGEIFFEISFTDYRGNAINPSEAILGIQGSSAYYTITETVDNHPTATYEGGTAKSDFVIVGNKMIVTNRQTAIESVITQTLKFYLKKLTTADKEFLYFNYVQA